MQWSKSIITVNIIITSTTSSHHNNTIIIIDITVNHIIASTTSSHQPHHHTTTPSSSSSGDVMIVPESWGHGVLNIQQSVAVATEGTYLIWYLSDLVIWFTPVVIIIIWWWWCSMILLCSSVGREGREGLFYISTVFLVYIQFLLWVINQSINQSSVSV